MKMEILHKFHFQKTKIMKSTLNYILEEYKSASGEIFRADQKLVIEKLQEIISDHNIAASARARDDEDQYLYNLPGDLTTKLGINKEFFRQFFITFIGNPSTNGGHFNYRGYNIGDEYHTDENAHLKYIARTLSCFNPSRWYGFGKDQMGYKYVDETKEVSAKFVDFILDNKVIDLNASLEHGSYAIGLLFYCLRSGDVISINKFKTHLLNESNPTLKFAIFGAFNNVLEKLIKVNIPALGMQLYANGWHELVHTSHKKLVSLLDLSKYFGYLIFDEQDIIDNWDLFSRSEINKLYKITDSGYKLNDIIVSDNPVKLTL